jgi:hypothetical protein
MRRVVLICLLPASLSLAAGGPGTVGADFLRLGIGARPMALAGAYTAIADDVFGMAVNPAGLTQIINAELGSYYANIVGDVHHGWVGFTQDVNDTWSYGVEVNMLYASETRRDSYGDPIGTYSVALGALGGAISMEPFRGFSLGLSGRYVVQKYDGEVGHGFAGDFGLLYHTRFNGFRVGVVAENLGPDVEFQELSESMPMGVRVGLGTSLFQQTLTIAGDFAYGFEGSMEAGVGIEWEAVRGVSFRAGYDIFGDFDSWSGVSLGIGLDALSGLIVGELDYAFVPQLPLGYVHRVSYTLKF